MVRRNKHQKDAKRRLKTIAETLTECPICSLPVPELISTQETHGEGIKCGHAFCNDCWKTYLVTQIQDGHSTTIECMEEGCHSLLVEWFVLKVIDGTPFKERYLRNIFYRYLQSNYAYRFCPNPDCSRFAHRLIPDTSDTTICCRKCQTRFCLKCGQDHPGYSCSQYVWMKIIICGMFLGLVCSGLLMILILVSSIEKNKQVL